MILFCKKTFSFVRPLDKCILLSKVKNVKRDRQTINWKNGKKCCAPTRIIGANKRKKCLRDLKSMQPNALVGDSATTEYIECSRAPQRGLRVLQSTQRKFRVHIRAPHNRLTVLQSTTKKYLECSKAPQRRFRVLQGTKEKIYNAPEHHRVDSECIGAPQRR